MSLTKKNNPFRPNNPIPPGLFAGRLDELSRIEQLLIQLKEENASNLLILGERGIGKSSMLLVSNYFAKGEINWINDEKFNFLTVHFNMDPEITQLDIIEKINNAIQRELGKNQKVLETIKKTWGFLQKVEMGGFKIRENAQKINESEIFTNFVYSLADTTKKLCKDGFLSEHNILTKKDGIVILIDEADNSNTKLNLGTFLKNLQESLIVEDCRNVMFILSGLPKVKDILLESHKSSLRMFEEMVLSPFGYEEIKTIYEKGLNKVNEKNPTEETSISKKAMEIMISAAEGYPHFAQQIGYSVFDLNEDNVISFETAWSAIRMKGGAIDRIGDRYYYDLYYKKIQEDSYREILNIIAYCDNEWITKKYIKEKYQGKEYILNNGLKALRDRNIIISKKGTTGIYKLQWVGFGVWIRLFCKKDDPNP
jgi:Cdc6-like AAA superfamily ATPase